MNKEPLRIGPAVAAICVFLSATIGLGQAAPETAKTPGFEVASIRQNLNPNPAWRMNFTPDGVSAKDVTLLYALQEAYGIYDRELWSGVPAWIDQKRFDIEAKFDQSLYSEPTLQQRRAMLQQLLADRFKLAVHHEAREFPLYALVIARGGPKVTETKPEDLQQNSTYGVMCVHKRNRKGLMEMSGCTMAQLAFSLGGSGRDDLSARRVVDQTGLTGHYTMTLNWTPIDTSNPASTTPSGPDAGGPSLFTALKEQLGLELKPIKGPLDTIVIDHVEMPSEN